MKKSIDNNLMESPNEGGLKVLFSSMPLWRYFYEITQIPHPSGAMEAIRTYLIDFAKEHNLEIRVDDAGNVLIKKLATPSMENRKTVCLQAHMDMVPQKNEGVAHNFEKDSLRVSMEGEWIKAIDTTLGADNGIGMAAMLAVLAADDLKHGAIEALFTPDEETGMYGAFGLQEGFLNADVLLNLDSEDEGELFVGCAGGMDVDMTFRYLAAESLDGDVAIKINISGLLGGHSGIDIKLERANANKLLFRVLKTAVSELEARLISVGGGSLRNAIPRESSAIVSIPQERVEDLLDFVEEMNELFNEEFAGIESGINLSAEETTMPDYVLPEEVQDDLINAVYAAPDGVYRHIPQVPEVVETSNNLAVIHSDEEKIVVKCLVRSSVESKKFELCSVLESIFALAGAKVEFSGGYPGWQPKLDSPILNQMKTIYKEKWDKEPQVKIIHAGLECGIIGSAYPALDMISFGPTIRHPHSPDEKVHVPSVQKFWELLIATLERI